MDQRYYVKMLSKESSLEHALKMLLAGSDSTQHPSILFEGTPPSSLPHPALAWARETDHISSVHE